MADAVTRKMVPEPEYDTLNTNFNALRDDLKQRGTLIHESNNQAADATPAAVDLPTTITLANNLKTLFNAHLAKTDAHRVADATNTVSAANATDQTSVNTLLNAIKTALIAHAGQASNVIKQAITQSSSASVVLSQPAAAIISCRVTAGAAQAGPRIITDSGGTPAASATGLGGAGGGVATLSDDGLTITLEAAATGITVEYIPRVPNQGFHVNPDTTASAFNTANASDLPSSEALANALQTAINAHIARTFSSVKVTRGVM